MTFYEEFKITSADDINKVAVEHRADNSILERIKKECGIEEEVIDLFKSGEIDFICDSTTAAAGKLDAELNAISAVEIMTDWVDYIKALAFEDESIAAAVIKKDLKGCIAELLKWSFENAKSIDKDIIKLAMGKDITYDIKLGIPASGRAKSIIKKYYES